MDLIRIACFAFVFVFSPVQILSHLYRFFLLLLLFLVMQWGLWNLSSLTLDGTLTPGSESVPTTGPPGTSPCVECCIHHRQATAQIHHHQDPYSKAPSYPFCSHFLKF